MIALAWLRTNVIQRWAGSVGRLGVLGMYRRTVRGEVWIPIFSKSSLAIRSSPQVGLFVTISAISFRSWAGTRGRPHGRDFHFQRGETLCDANGSACRV